MLYIYIFFSDINTLCTTVPYQYDARLYTETKLFITKHVENLLEGVEQDGQLLLKSYSEAWAQYSKGIKAIDRLY